MRIGALKEKAGAYEFLQADGTVYGGIVISGKNRGIGFTGDFHDNRLIFEFEDGLFNKSVKLCRKSKDQPIGSVALDFTDSGTLETPAGKFEWKSVGSSKVWLDEANSSVVFFDLENDGNKPATVLSSDSLDPDIKELLLMCGWYLLVVEYRAGLTNALLAGMPAKTDDFKQVNTGESIKHHGDDWFDFLTDAIDMAID